MKIGFIGLGLMGEPMCSNLIEKSGCEVYVFDLSPAPVERLAAKGAKPRGASREIGETCDVVFSMVPKTEHVEAVYAELLPVVRAGQLLVDMSTISPLASAALAEKVAERGGRMLDAPVVKSRPAAIAGKLGIYIGGAPEDFERAKPLLLMMGERVKHLGANGSGLVMKLCHNALVAQIQNGVNETMELAARTAGIDPLTFAEAIGMGGGQNFYLDGKAAPIAAGDFTTAFSVENMNKDVHLARELCDSCGLEAEGVALTVRRYESAMERGLGRLDFSATRLLQEKGAD